MPLLPTLNWRLSHPNYGWDFNHATFLLIRCPAHSDEEKRVCCPNPNPSTLNPQPLMRAVKATVPWWSLPTCFAHVAMESQSFQDPTKALGQLRGPGGTGFAYKKIAWRTLRFLVSSHLRILAHGAVPAQALNRLQGQAVKHRVIDPTSSEFLRELRDVHTQLIRV